MSELSFLIELLLNHKLSVKTKAAVADRIKQVESNQFMVKPAWMTPAAIPSQPGIIQQAPSTLALMAKHGLPMPPVTATPEMPPVEQIAQTPAAAAAMNHRHETISHALSGKPEKGRTSPRKF